MVYMNLVDTGLVLVYMFVLVHGFPHFQTWNLMLTFMKFGFVVMQGSVIYFCKWILVLIYEIICWSHEIYKCFSCCRVPTVGRNSNERLLHQRSGLSENGLLSRRSSSGSLDSVTENGALAAKPNIGIEETSLDCPQMLVDTKGFVNNSVSPKTKTRHEIVNNSESLRVEAQLKFVNSKIEGPRMENHFEDEGDEFD